MRINISYADGGGIIQSFCVPKFRTLRAGWTGWIEVSAFDVVPLLLVETYGGFGADLNRLFRAAAHSQANALSKAQLDDQASWSTRSWTALQGQRLSLAIQFAVAYEIINELGYGDGAATTAAPRGAQGGARRRRRR